MSTLASGNFERIWLEPREGADPYIGRQWCQDNQWGEDGVEYVRADLVPPPPSALLMGSLEEIGRVTEARQIRWNNPPIRPGTTLYAAPGSTLKAEEIECVCKRAVCSYDPDFGCGIDWSKERQDV